MNKSVKMFTCEICEDRYPDSEKVSLSHCEHFYCTSCLQQYIVYKIGLFEELICPHDECDELVDQNTKF